MLCLSEKKNPELEKITKKNLTKKDNGGYCTLLN